MEHKKRLIDANALRKRMFSYYGCVDENTSKEYYRGETLMNYEVADMIEDCIDNAPTVDAVEVVRCKDCKYWNKDALSCDTLPWVNSVEHANWYAEDFCAYGERRLEDGMDK